MPRIIKIKHDTDSTNSTQIPYSLFNKDLSLGALGLYGFLLSRKRTEFSLDEIKNKSSDPLISNLDILNELEQHHLVMPVSSNKTELVWRLLPVKQV